MNEAGIRIFSDTSDFSGKVFRAEHRQRKALDLDRMRNDIVFFLALVFFGRR